MAGEEKRCMCNGGWHYYCEIHGRGALEADLALAQEKAALADDAYKLLNPWRGQRRDRVTDDWLARYDALVSLKDRK